MKSIFSVVFLMEWKKFWSNKKIILSSFLLPILMMSFIIYSVTTLEQEESGGSIFIYCDHDLEEVISGIDLGENIETISNDYEQTFEDLVSSKRNYVGILVDEAQCKITIGYDSSLLSNVELLYTAYETANELNIAISAYDFLDAYTNEEPIIVQSDISDFSDRVTDSLKPILMTISTIAIIAILLSLLSIMRAGTLTVYRYLIPIYNLCVTIQDILLGNTAVLNMLAAACSMLLLTLIVFAITVCSFKKECIRY